MWELQTLLPSLPPFTSQHVLACISALGQASLGLMSQQRHGTLGCQGLPPLPPSTIPCTNLPLSSLALYSAPNNSQFMICPLPECKGGVCASWGSRCYITDLPLPEIRFGDIRIERLAVLAPPLPLPSWL